MLNQLTWWDKNLNIILSFNGKTILFIDSIQIRLHEFNVTFDASWLPKVQYFYIVLSIN